ncbi:MAG: DUF1129 domain-containing protein [Methanomicrobiales archaeon]|nr:DUF1129 domain-containing protein [Methanomicrobiales archaeon]
MADNTGEPGSEPGLTNPVISWVLSQIEEEKDRQTRLLKSDIKVHHNTLFIVGGLLLNILAASLLPNYLVYWIAASFFLYVLAPLVMLIPTRRKEVIFPAKKDLEKYLLIVKQYGLSKDTQTLGHIIWNVFFINSQAIAIAYVMIFAIDALFAALSGFYLQTLPSATSVQVILTSLAIIVFFGGIWMYKPYSHHFIDSVFSLHSRIKTRLKKAWKVILVMGAISAALSILVVTAMLLPGFILGEVVSAPDVINAGSAFPIFFIFFSQLAMVRYLQGVYSKDLVLGFSEKRVTLLKEILPRLSVCPPDREKFRTLSPEECLQSYEDLKKLYIRSKMYTHTFHHLFGYLPVYVVVPDFKLILDKGTLRLLEGDIALEDSLF